MAARESDLASKRVHVLIWAVGEARRRHRRPASVERSRTRAVTPVGPLAFPAPAGADFFTEWQPAADSGSGRGAM